MEIFIKKEYSGSKIERFLVKFLNISKVFIYKLIREKKIALFRNSLRISVKPGIIIEFQDIIKIFANISSNVTNNSNEMNEITKKFLKNHVIWDDSDFAIIYKPKGLASQLGKGITTSLDNLIRPYYLVHRLDKNTEGLMIIAKTVEKARMFGNLLKDNRIHKYYVCGLNGHLSESKWVDANLLKVNKRTIVHDDLGKPAKTKFIPIQYYPEKNQTVAIAKIIHGRTHQIRVHATCLGLTIINDEIYDTNFQESNFNINSYDKPLYLCSYAIKLPFKNQVFKCYKFNFPKIKLDNQLIHQILAKEIQDSDDESCNNLL